MFRLQLGISLVNLPEALEQAKRTNKRVYLELRKLDQKLAAETNIEAFTQFFFSSQFRNFMDARVDTARAQWLRNARDLKADIAKRLLEMPTMTDNYQENKDSQEFQDILRKWEYLSSLNDDVWTLQLSWDWPNCEGNRRRDGSIPDVCELPPPKPTTQATASSTTPTVQSTMSSPQMTGAPSITPSATTTSPVPCGTQQCSTITCPDGHAGECMALPMNRGLSATTTTAQEAITPIPSSLTCFNDEDCGKCEDNNEVGRSLSQTPTTAPPVTTTTASPPRWTGTCNKQGTRFEKSQALKWVEEFCEDAHENEWSDKWFSQDSMQVKTKGIKVYNDMDQPIEAAFRFFIKVSKRSGKEKQFCDQQGDGSNIKSALELLKKSPVTCKEQLGILVNDCNWNGEAGRNHPSGGNRPGLCLEWELSAKIEA
ncbi:hypothetical protein CkaCkLH20_09730 [Colletotrichum karsti]|uniref:Uncharacterized protein n=1 Tax=Colletotrichum karsti TaxID=1095194 RepID=A0A9P6LHS2_9PEZI|nr:uncharacterized protein CkaCkLH20_09730 [Colletotrichum karsti]KAF9872867.1 hypothetical protein CkaCkLH20_09730 [Colletotrichum karsti]